MEPAKPITKPKKEQNIKLTKEFYKIELTHKNKQYILTLGKNGSTQNEEKQLNIKQPYSFNLMQIATQTSFLFVIMLLDFQFTINK